jgi:hypothetical protein
VECGIFALGAALIRISARRSIGPVSEGLLLGVASGVLFGVSDIALKYLTGAVHAGVHPTPKSVAGAREFAKQSADDPKGRREDSKDRPPVLPAGQRVATVAPRPTTGAGDAMLLLDRLAVIAEGVVVIHVPVRGRVLGVIRVKRRFVRHRVAPLSFPLGRSC